MKLWDGHRWSEYSGDPVTAAVFASSSPPTVLDPAIAVITEDDAIPLVERAHEAFRMQNDPTGDHQPVKLAGQLPAPIASFNFDTTDEED